MKKTYISVKCGLSRDPKHRQAMGECIWLFLHMIDTADWDTGTVKEWKDEDAAEAMGMPVRTLREQRRKLAELDYITCKQKQYNQDIVIHNWTNPREYSGEIKNKKQGGNGREPQNNAQDYSQGDNQDYSQGSSQDVTPTYNPKNQLTNKSNNNKQSLDLFVSYLGRFYSQREIERWVILYDSVGGARAEELAQWAAKKEIHLSNRPSLIDALETAAKKWQDAPARAGKPKRAADTGDPNKYTSGQYSEFLA